MSDPLDDLAEGLLDQGRNAAPEIFAGRFEIEREAGVGGMGIVYRAFDRVLGLPVALKILRRTDPKAIRRFETEAAALGNLDHPAIVRYLAHGLSDEGEPYLAMEWVDGQTLRTELSRALADGKRLEIDDVIVLGYRLADALAAAHAVGIVHRDVKPSNILLVGGLFRDAKLADFGVVRADTAAHTTTSGVVIGTIGYMAPEQARGDADLDGRADLFALGCVLFRCLTNKEVFEGTAAMTVLAKLLLHEAPRVSELRPDVPPELDGLIARLLSKDRAERPTSALAVKRELQRIAQESTDRTVRSPSFHTPDAVSFPSMVSKPAPRSSARTLFAVCSAFALLSVAVSVIAFRGARPPQTTPAAAASEPSPAGATIVSFSPSPTCRPEAVVPYREGMSALRNAAWELAHGYFQKAAAADLVCPEAQLRLAMTGKAYDSITKAREQFRHATELRDALSARDRIVYDALLPLLTLDKPDYEAAYRVLEAGILQFPHDAELLKSAGSVRLPLRLNASALERNLELAMRALAVDPKYADAWQLKAQVLARLGRFDEALQAQSSCLEVAPGSGDCFQDRAFVLERTGQCEKTISLIREWLAHVPKSALAYRHLANALASTGASEEAVKEALQQRWNNATEERRASGRLRLDDLARLAALKGDFATADALASELAEQAKGEAMISPHLRAASMLVEARLEMGEPASAAAIAERYFHRKEAWTTGEPPRNLLHLEPIMLATLLADRRISRERWQASVELWEQHAQERMTAFEAWALRWGPMVSSPGSDPVRTWRERPESATEDTASFGFLGFNLRMGDIYAGRLAVAAGETESAVAFLDTAAKNCQPLEDPFANTRVHLWLGDAKAREGDKAGACAAYDVVLQRWGAAKPRSKTADEAKRRRRTLGCRS